MFNTGGRASTEVQKQARRRLIEQTRTGRFLGVGTKMLDMLLGNKRRGDATLRKKLIDMALESGKEVYIRQQTAIINRIDSCATIKKAKIPFLCVSGAEDVMTAPELLQEVHALADNSQYYELSDCGHLSPVEMPEKVTDILKDWLKV